LGISIFCETLRLEEKNTVVRGGLRAVLMPSLIS